MSMHNETVERILRHPDLPSPSTTAVEIIKLFGKDNVSLGEIADVIGKDPALAGKVLRYSNSASCRGFKPTTIILDAVKRIGLVAVKHLSLGLSVVSSGKNIPSAFNADMFWLSSLATGYAARSVMMHTNTSFAPDEAFTIGLLLPIGKLAMACSLKNEYTHVSHDVLNDDTDDEIDVFGAGWNEISAKMMSKWGFVGKTVSVISGFGNTTKATSNQDARLISCMRIARAVAIGVVTGNPPVVSDEIDMDILADIVVDVERDIGAHRDDFPNADPSFSRTHKSGIYVCFGMDHPEGTVGLRHDDFDDFLKAILSTSPEHVIIKDGENTEWIASVCSVLGRMESTKKIPITVVEASETTKKSLSGTRVVFA